MVSAWCAARPGVGATPGRSRPRRPRSLPRDGGAGVVMPDVAHLDVRVTLVVAVALVACRAVVLNGRSRPVRARLRGRPASAPTAGAWVAGLGGARLADVPPAAAWAGVATVVLAGAVVGPVLVGLGSAVGAVVVVGVRHERRRSAQRRADALIPGFLDELARRLRAGRS